MIATVTLNPALDITYELDAVAWQEPNRVRAMAQRAGGKGVNVARILHALGEETLVCCPLGGATGFALQVELERDALRSSITPIGGETRRTVSVVDGSRGEATGFWEPGPFVTPDEWQAFLAAFDLLEADAIVLAGSLPLGVPPDAYAELCDRAPAPVILDADGDALRLGVAGGPVLVTPNRDELARATGGRRAAGIAGVLAAADALRAEGAGAVVVSVGESGMVCDTDEGAWRAEPAERVNGNPTGAGDAAVAALARGLVAGTEWPELLRDATALSAAAVAAPLAGSFDEDVYRRHLEEV